MRQLFMAMSVLRTVFLCASVVYGNVRAGNCVSVCVSCLWQCPCWELCFCVHQLFMAMSVLGTVFRGYFFAFHLLNIVNNNQLLKGVIQAVTQNGPTTSDVTVYITIRIFIC